MKNTGTVYLLHFSRPFSHALHYLGWGKGDASKRIADHIAGKGSALTRAAVTAGIELTLVKTWENETRSFERMLKNKKNAKGICPLCKAAYNEAARLRMRRRRARGA
jgi:predicted GIY-YIG superfamily endonuclease